MVLSEGSFNSKGLLTYFSKRITEMFLIKPLFNDDRMIISLLEGIDRNLVLANVYAPCNTKEKIIFFEKLNNIISSVCYNIANYHLIVLGDFNSVMDNDLDIISGDQHSQILVAKFNNFINELCLCDAWRLKNPLVRTHTWSRVNPFVARRLDYCFIGEDLTPFLHMAEVKSIEFSDHRVVSIEIKFSDFKKGKYIYKMNTSILSGPLFVKQMKVRIANIKRDNIRMDPHLVWESIKIEVREFAQQYSKFHGMKRNKEINALYRKLNDLENQITNIADKNMI